MDFTLQLNNICKNQCFIIHSPATNNIWLWYYNIKTKPNNLPNLVVCVFFYNMFLFSKVISNSWTSWDYIHWFRSKNFSHTKFMHNLSPFHLTLQKTIAGMILPALYNFLYGLEMSPVYWFWRISNLPPYHYTLWYFLFYVILNSFLAVTRGAAGSHKSDEIHVCKCNIAYL